MELTQLKQFKVLAQTQNTVEASAILSISQPALTKAVQRLEMELGTNLFDRIGRKLLLNENGKTVLSSASDILQNLEDMKLDLQSGVPEDALRICSQMTSFATYLVPLFLERHPSCVVYPQTRCDQYFESYLVNGAYDIAITTEPIENPELENHKLGEDYVWVTVPKDHPLAEKKLLTMEDLVGETFICVESRLNAPLCQMFQDRLAQPDSGVIILWQGSIAASMEAAKRTSYLTLSSSIGVRNQTDFLDSRVFISVDEKEGAFLTNYAVHRRDNGEKCRPFLDFLKQYYKDMKCGRL